MGKLGDAAYHAGVPSSRPSKKPRVLSVAINFSSSLASPPPEEVVDDTAAPADAALPPAALCLAAWSCAVCCCCRTSSNDRSPGGVSAATVLCGTPAAERTLSPISKTFGKVSGLIERRFFVSSSSSFRPNASPIHCTATSCEISRHLVCSGMQEEGWITSDDSGKNFGEDGRRSDDLPPRPHHLAPPGPRPRHARLCQHMQFFGIGWLLTLPSSISLSILQLREQGGRRGRRGRKGSMGDSGSYQALLLLVRQLCAAHHKAVHVVQHRIPQGVMRIRGLLPSICLSFCHEFPTWCVF